MTRIDTQTNSLQQFGHASVAYMTLAEACQVADNVGISLHDVRLVGGAWHGVRLEVIEDE